MNIDIGNKISLMADISYDEYVHIGVVIHIERTLSEIYRLFLEVGYEIFFHIGTSNEY